MTILDEHPTKMKNIRRIWIIFIVFDYILILSFAIYFMFHLPLEDGIQTSKKIAFIGLLLLFIPPIYRGIIQKAKISKIEYKLYLIAVSIFVSWVILAELLTMFV